MRPIVCINIFICEQLSVWTFDSRNMFICEHTVWTSYYMIYMNCNWINIWLNEYVHTWWAIDSMSMLRYKYLTVRTCVHVITWVCELNVTCRWEKVWLGLFPQAMITWKYEHLVIWRDEHVTIWICNFMNKQLSDHTTKWVCKLMNLWPYEYMNFEFICLSNPWQFPFFFLLFVARLKKLARSKKKKSEAK